jgi:hypothetical protein
MRNQRGQSMTEFAVGAAAMGLLLLGSITIAGYQEIQRRTSMASRQAAFQSAWNDAGSDRTAGVRQIVVQRLDEPSLTNAVGHGRYVGDSGVTASASLLPAPGIAGDAARAMIAPLQVTGGFLGGNFNLQTDGLLSGFATVEIQPQSRLPRPFDSIRLPLRQPFALMTDAWNSGSPEHVRSRTSGLVPTNALSGLQSLWRPLSVPLALIEPSLSRLCLGVIEPERVPEDRLGAGATPLTGRCP